MKTDKPITWPSIQAASEMLRKRILEARIERLRENLLRNFAEAEKRRKA